MPDAVRILTLNVHKGMSAWRRRFVLDELRQAVRSTHADVVCLQEVVGEDPTGHLPHYEFLADSLWPQAAYGRNAVSPQGHHGNAVLSRYPVAMFTNHDVSTPGAEARGILQCTLDVPGWPQLDIACVHFGLREHERQQQWRQLTRVVDGISHPVVVAGDFNDWRGRAGRLPQEAGLTSAFAACGLPAPRTFPAQWPVLRLDHVYTRGVRVTSAMVLSERPWPHLSDHLPLMVEVEQP